MDINNEFEKIVKEFYNKWYDEKEPRPIDIKFFLDDLYEDSEELNKINDEFGLGYMNEIPQHVYEYFKTLNEVCNSYETALREIANSVRLANCSIIMDEAIKDYGGQCLPTEEEMESYNT